MYIERLSIEPFREWLFRNARLLLRMSLIVAILLASASLARRPSVLFLALFPVLGIALVLLRRPVFALVGVIVGGLVVPFGIGTGSESEINAPLLLTGMLMGIWLLDMVRQHEIRLIPSRTTLPLVLFLVVVLLAFGFGQLPWFYVSAAPMRAQIGGLAIFVLSAGAFWVTAHFVKEQHWLERLTWIFLVVGGIYILGRFVPQFGNLADRFYIPRAVGSLFWTWLVALSFSQAVFNQQLRPVLRFALGVLAAATLLYSMTRNLGWTSGWAPAMASVVVILLVAKPRLGILFAAAALMVVVLMPERIFGLFEAGDNSYSAMTRVEAWNIMFKLIGISPILGMGPANYYFYTPLFPILGYSVRFNSHNNYVDLIAQTGLLGLVCFLWFSLEVGRLGWRLRKRVPAGFPKAYVYGALGGLAGTLVAGMLGDWVLPFVYNIGFSGFRASVLGWLFLGGLVALEQMTAQQSPNTHSVQIEQP